MATAVATTIPLPDGSTLRGAVAVPQPRPTPPRRHRGVVVLHEMFGLNDDMRRICGHLADHGYVALAPDLYSHGNRALCLSRVLLAASSASAQARVLDDIGAARDALAARDDVDPDRIAVIGFCAGGGFALAFAAARTGVQAAAVNYGVVPTKREALDDVCPVVASYGERDRLFLGHAERLRSHLEALGVPHDVKVYEGAGHSFLSYDNGPAWLLKVPSPMNVGYNEAAADDAWARIFDFFDRHLGDPEPDGKQT